MDRDRLLKDGEKSFLDFYSSRQQMKNSPVIDNFNSRGVIGNSESRNSQQGSFGRKSVSHHTAQAQENTRESSLQKDTFLTPIKKAQEKDDNLRNTFLKGIDEDDGEDSQDFDNWLQKKQQNDHVLLPVVVKKNVDGVQLSEISSLSLNLDDCKLFIC